jgi:3-phosphoshikimate 1-carboxyvinyltransferase
MDEILNVHQVPERLSGVFHLPYSKSMYNRALVIGAASGKSFRVSANSSAEDCEVLKGYLSALNYRIESGGEGIYHFIPGNFPSQVNLDLRMAGTAMRFLTGLACIMPVCSAFRGSERLSMRPVGALKDALISAGGRLEYESAHFALPVRIYGDRHWSPKCFDFAPGESSQMLSALLLLGPHLQTGTRIQVPKVEVVSKTYVEMTLNMLSLQGIYWVRDDSGFVLKSCEWKDEVIFVERDWSSASYAFAWALMFPSDFMIPGLSAQSLQGDRAQVKWFEHLGLKIEFMEKGVRVQSPGYRDLPAFDFDFSDMPDLAQTFAVLALFAKGKSTLRGLETLRVKETDRVSALQAELSKLGAIVQVIGNQMEIEPVEVLMPCMLDTYGDHRMAMSFSILAGLYPGEIGIRSPEVVSKSFPDFWHELSRIGINFSDSVC